jgi:hypothetical protein
MLKTHLIALPVIALLSNTVKADDWTFQLEPYVMATNISGDAVIGRISGAPIDVDFNTILENLEMAAMLHFEAHHKSGWGLAMDYAFMDLGHKKSNERDGVLNAKIRQGVLEALGLYRVKYRNSSLDYFAGVRWWDNDLSLTLDPAFTTGSTDVNVKEDWLDAVVGVRVITELNNRWNFMARADLGGFDLSADFTSTVESGVTYKINQLITIDMKYKATWVDYDNEKNVGGVGNYQYDTITHGPVLGLNFTF